MTIITLTSDNNKKYNIDKTSGKLQLVKRITTAINQKDTILLNEIETKLSLIKRDQFAHYQLQKVSDFIKKVKEEQREIDDTDDNTLITDVHLFPRSEYYTRFDGTTAFAMTEPAFWETYHRSESTRFFSEAGGRKETQFLSPCMKKVPKVHSFFAHTGGFHSTFSIEEYKNLVTLEKIVDELKGNVRDDLLIYKNSMTKVIVNHFEELTSNEQKIKKKYTQKNFYLRPIIYAENDYPCVLVSLPILNPAETKNEATIYWHKHPKPFQKLLIACFIAYTNVEAMHANIPIEIVSRASFGHNIPSVCETNNTFRISVGVIPKCYANLIATALFKLNTAISIITDQNSPPAPFDEKFLTQVRMYNVKKLKGKIYSNSYYDSLLKHNAFAEAENSDTAFQQLYEEFHKLNNKKKVNKGKSVFIPVNIENKSIWEAIRETGDSMGKSILDECFRQKGTVDWFANQVMDALLRKSAHPIEDTLYKLLKYLTYNETVTMDYEKIHTELQKKYEFENKKFTELYKDDPDFFNITRQLCKAFSINPPTYNLYARLEKAGTKFMTTYKSKKDIDTTPDYGSDSEFSADLSDEEQKNKFHFAHTKLRLCAGMKAILLAQYAALSYLRLHKVKEYTTDVMQMYYEVEDALQLVETNELTIKSTGKKILFFDLNHCNATNSATNYGLKEKLESFDPIIVILDYTSSTLSTIMKALKMCFFRKNIEFVLLVESGLKNEQGGQDFNPYGEIRVLANTNALVKKVVELIKKGLSLKDKLTAETHEMVRICKKRGLAFSLYNAFKQAKECSNDTVDEERDIPNPSLSTDNSIR